MKPTAMRFLGVCCQAIVAVICLAGCSKDAAVVPVGEAVATNTRPKGAELSLPLEHVVVPVTNTISTTIAFRRSSPPPWTNGNYLTFHYRAKAAPGQPEEWVSWNVVNMHAENFFEIARRLKMTSVEVHVLRAGSSPATRPEPGRPDRTIVTHGGYAVITDPRIPRQWFLSEPGGNTGRLQSSARMDPKIAGALQAAWPEKFRSD